MIIFKATPNAKHNSSNLFQKRKKMNLKEEDNKEKPKQEEDKKETNNNPPISLLSDIIKDKTDNKPLLSDIISGNKEEDKEVYELDNTAKKNENSINNFRNAKNSKK